MSDRYHTPPEGTDDWHEPLNENFEHIGADVDNLESQVHLWDEYELVFDDEVPSADKYIRIETE